MRIRGDEFQEHFYIKSIAWNEDNRLDMVYFAGAPPSDYEGKEH